VPIACFLANSKSEVIPLVPKFLYEKYKFKKVGMKPKIIPEIKKVLKILSFLNKLTKIKGVRPKRGTKII
tara:strand:+ start:416 stop:625 length:210 start_codon:yes stop_codon:yes gene_type:complete